MTDEESADERRDAPNEGRETAFVWPPPDEELDAWEMIPLFAPANAPLPAPVSLLETSPLGTSSAPDAGPDAREDPDRTLVLSRDAFRRDMAAWAKADTRPALKATVANAAAVDPDPTITLRRIALSSASAAMSVPASDPPTLPLAPLTPRTPPPPATGTATTASAAASTPRAPTPVAASDEDTRTFETLRSNLPGAATPTTSAIDTRPHRPTPVTASDDETRTFEALRSSLPKIAPPATPAVDAPPRARSGMRAGLLIAAVIAAGMTAYGVTRWMLPRDPGARVVTARVATGSAATTTDAADSVASAASSVAGATTAAGAASPSPGAAGTLAARTELEIRSNPSGMRIIVGGRERGLTPVIVSDIGPGLHEVLIFGPFRPNLRRVDVAAGTRTTVVISADADADADALAAAAPAISALTRSRSDAAAQGGPALAAPPPKAGSPLPSANPPGAPAASAAGDDSAPARRASTGAITPGAPVSSELPVSPSQGRLIVESPLALDIRANGRRVGNSGDGSIPLAAGSYQLELVNDSVDYREVAAIRISAGQRLALPIELPRSTLTLEGPPGTRVWVDGREVGQTPITRLALPIGPHDVRFRHPDFGERRVTALVKVGLAARVAVDFKAP